jgi:hypothetical protein
MISNFSSRFSFRSLVEQTGIQSNITVQNYIGYLENANFGKVLNKFAHSTKKQINSQKKFYLTDHAFIPKISTKITKDFGKILENIVFSALLENNDVFYFSEKKECDFIAIKLSKEVEVFQVCYDFNNENKKREVSGLVEAMQYMNLDQGMILTMSQEEELEVENKKIRLIPVWKWLIQNNS